MNVDFPGFGTAGAFWTIFGVMAAALVGMLAFFRYKRWLWQELPAGAAPRGRRRDATPASRGAGCRGRAATPRGRCGQPGPT